MGKTDKNEASAENMPLLPCFLISGVLSSSAQSSCLS